jgi:hypothetical protein
LHLLPEALLRDHYARKQDRCGGEVIYQFPIILEFLNANAIQSEGKPGRGGVEYCENMNALMM